MYNLSNMFNVIVELHKVENGKLKAFHCDAQSIFRYTARFSNAIIDEKREQGTNSCSTLEYTSLSGHAYSSVVFETPAEIKTKIEEAETEVLQQIKASRLPLDMLPLKPIIALNRYNDGGHLQSHFDANAVYRFEAKASEDGLIEKRKKGHYCSTICFHHGNSTDVLETPDEIKQEVMSANQKIIKRIQNLRLSIR